MDPVLPDLHLVDLHIPVSMAHLKDPLSPGELYLLLELCPRLVPDRQRIKTCSACLRDHFPVQSIEVAQKLHLFLLIEPDIHDRVHGDLPQLPVGIRLQLQIPVHQLYRDKRDHVLRRLRKLHVPGKRNSLLKTLHRHLPAACRVDCEHEKISVDMDLPVERLRLHILKTHILPQKSLRIRIISRY